jgi:hypothetical protein
LVFGLHAFNHLAEWNASIVLKRVLGSFESVSWQRDLPESLHKLRVSKGDGQLLFGAHFL